MKNSTSTHPLPTHHPSLNIGDAVFSVVSRIDINYCKSIIKVHKYLSPLEAIDQFIMYQDSEIAKQISTNEYLLVSNLSIGYIMSDKRRSTEVETVNGIPLLHGYKVKWENNDSSGLSYVLTFEDETSFVPISDIVMLSPQQFYEEITNEKGTTG